MSITPNAELSAILHEIAGKHRDLSALHEKLAAAVLSSSSIGQVSETSGTLANEAAATAEREKAKTADAKAKKAEAKAKADAEAKAKADAEKPKLTPEQIAARLKESIVALATKDRPKCAAIVASYGAKKFSEIPADKHAEALVEITAALNGTEKSKAEDDILG